MFGVNDFCTIYLINTFICLTGQDPNNITNWLIDCRYSLHYIDIDVLIIASFFGPFYSSFQTSILLHYSMCILEITNSYFEMYKMRVYQDINEPDRVKITPNNSF